MTSEVDTLRAIIEKAPEAIIFADPAGTIRLWNAQAQSIFGYPAGEAIGRSLDLIIPEHLRATHWRGYERAIAEGRTHLPKQPIVTRATHKDGSKRYVELSFAIITHEVHGVLGAVASARDVTSSR